MQREPYYTIVLHLMTMLGAEHAREASKQADFETWAESAALKLGLHFKRSMKERKELNTDGLFLSVRAQPYML